jgi:hypothetical protein
MAVAAPMLMTALGGCVYSERVVEVERPAPVVVAAATSSPDRVVYPEGRWQLYGDGRGTPYYWAWTPTGMTPPAPPAYPTASAPAPVVVAPAPPTDRIVYADGRWQLYGDGKITPYYWVWVPAGRTVAMYPAPPPLPQGK